MKNFEFKENRDFTKSIISSLNDYQFQLATTPLSPTPLPRKQFAHHLLSTTYTMNESNSSFNDNNIDSSEAKLIANSSDSTLNTTTADLFDSSTMPLPRKPRILKIEQTLTKQESSFVNDYYNNSILNPLIVHLNPFEYQEYSCEARTAASKCHAESKLVRQNNSFTLTRPNAPPPPPPKCPPPIIPPPSPNAYAFLSSTKPLSMSPPLRFSTPYKHHHSKVNSSKMKILLGFEPLEKETRPRLFQHMKQFFEYLQLKRGSSSFSNVLVLYKAKLNVSFILRILSLLLVLAIFVTCVASVYLFQMQVHYFYQNFLSTTSNNFSNSSSSSLEDLEYLTAGSNLIQQTILACNGPYFSYQMNNLLVLPFSLLLVLSFNIFEKDCAKTNSKSVKEKKRHSRSTINPFQRKNSFFVAALFCILANEIFKMIESSMFNETSNQSFNSTAQMLNSIMENNRDGNFSSFGAMRSNHTNSSNLQSSNTDFLKIGFGIKPASLKTRLAKTSTQTTKRKTTKSMYMLLPAVLSYSKPKLRPRLSKLDFETTTQSTIMPITTTVSTTTIDAIVTVSSINSRINSILTANLGNHVANSANKTVDVVNSFNKTLKNSSQMTLFEFSMNIYQNEYIQDAFKRVFTTNGTLFEWKLIVDKIQTIGIMLAEVLIIGMRYYPLIGVLEKNSVICLLLASVYVWLDLVYNVGLVGLCEGLRLNVSFGLLKDIRRVFGVGFLLDIKEKLKFNDTSESTMLPIDAKLLFSINRIIYSIVKSLPHFYCLSYVAVRLTSKFCDTIYRKTCKRQKSLIEYNNYYYYEKSLLITSNCKVNNNKYSLIYQKISNNHKTADRVEKFEECYVRNLFKKNQIMRRNSSGIKAKVLDCLWSPNFRFSTRIVCTYTVCFTVLYYLTCFLIFYGSIFVDIIYLPVAYKYAIVASTLIAFIVCFIQLVLSLGQFKFHLEMLYKGKSDPYLLDKSYFSNRKLATSSFNYAGYAVTYTCWGYIILFTLLAMVTFQVATMVIFGGSTFGFFILVILCPFGISIVLMKLLNRCISSLAAKFCFLQRKSKVLALKNMKFYGLFLYFKFCYDCFTGIAFCLFRMLRSMLLCVVFMPRLDYSFMGRSLEKMDTAFMSYVGYLHMESHHTNPILVAFCRVLKANLKTRRKLSAKNGVNIVKDLVKKNRIRTRWFLFYLMTKNIQLIKMRKK